MQIMPTKTGEQEMKETRVGYVTTSILEELCKEYIDKHTIITHQLKRQYVGETKYLIAYKSLVEYNRNYNKEDKSK